MLISYNWLKDLIAIDKPAPEVAALLTGTGLEDAAYYTATQDALARILLDGVLPPEAGAK